VFKVINILALLNFKRARVFYILQRYAIKHDLWETVCKKLVILQGLSSVEKAHLRELCTLFLHEKNIFSVQNFQLTDEMRVIIATQACLPILGLGFTSLNGWSDIIVYPDAFRVNRDEMDEYGIVHQGERILSGEAWSRGPVILSWQDIESDMHRKLQGHNVIVHEISHKLDMLNGRANGMPPLHSSMQSEQWTAAFSQAYQLLNQRLEHHHRVCVNPYAASSPAEFFAVFTEYFFCAPEILSIHFSEVYQQLRLYYRQDPLSRMGASKT
jgi:Mlc titration factor MtfA (ptsG expression regulator)